MEKPFQAEDAGEALLELLAARGVEYFIGGGAGTDFPPIIEAFARRIALGLPCPAPVTAVHEITTAAMAHGYTMVSGKVPFAMVHSSVGTANALCGVINAERIRVPLFLAAGRSPLTEQGMRGSRTHGVHWAQEAYDQAGMLREYVKWEYELRLASQLETVIDRGFALAQSPVPGPVYLTLPLEVLGQSMKGLHYSENARIRPAGSSVAGTDELRQAAEKLLAAKNPLVITTTAGRDPASVAPFVEFIDSLAIPVVETWPTHMNFPQDHPMHLGFDGTGLLADADVVLVIESDVPWFPYRESPPENATVIHIDEDPLYRNFPYRGFAADLSLAGSPRLILQALTGIIRSVQPDEDTVRERRLRFEKLHIEQRKKWRATAETGRSSTPIDPAWLTRCIAEQVEENDIVISENNLVPTQISFNRPGSFFNHSHAGGLGWSSGAALGARLARPDATIFCCIGDGTYTFGAPIATHHTSALNRLPVLFVIFNNADWNKTRIATRAYSPDGFVTRSDKMPLCDLEPTPDYEKICIAAGGYGERVEDPAELPDAIGRALNAVKNEKRQALLNVIVSKS